MSHSPALYLVGPDGDWLRQFTYGTPAPEILATFNPGCETPMKRLLIVSLALFAASPALACEVVKAGDIEIEHAWSRATTRATSA